MTKWLLSVAALAVMSATGFAQDVKGGEEKVAFEKKSFPFEGEVSVERLNVRMFPKNDQTSIITSVLGLGDKVTVVAEKDEYFQILPPKGSNVWITAKNIKREGETGTATANEIPVRLDSRVNADVLCTLKENETVKVVGEHMGWLKIEAPAGVKYFVGKKYVHLNTEVAVKATVPAPSKTSGGAKKPDLAPAAGGSDVEARQLIASANAELKKQDALMADKKYEQMDYSGVVADYRAAVAKAQTDAVRSEAERGLERSLAVSRVWEAAKVAVEQQKKSEADALAKKLAAKSAVPVTAFQGYIDTTGILFKRPGTHKLVMNGRIVCFIRIKDGDDKMLARFNDGYAKFVGVNGTVIKNPEGWDGYSVVVVDEMIPLDKE